MARKMALKAGYSRYYSAVPCRRGHLSERRTSDNHCIQCHNENRNLRRAQSPVLRESISEYFSVYRVKNGDRLRGNDRDRYATNIERERNRTIRWREDNPERARLAVRRWKRDNPEKTRESEHRRRARQKDAKGSFVAADIKDILLRQKNRCAYWKVCGSAITEEWHLDHIVPLALGGSNERRNIQICCQTCNLKKGAKHPVEFARQYGLLI